LWRRREDKKVVGFGRRCVAVVAVFPLLLVAARGGVLPRPVVVGVGEVVPRLLRAGVAAAVVER
jgi:hypothetical protein